MQIAQPISSFDVNSRAQLGDVRLQFSTRLASNK